MLAHTPKQAPSRLRILVVEDDSDTAALMSKVLDLEGFESRSVGSYKEALATAGEWVPDVLVCDIGLPGKDGFEVMKKMREAYPGLHGLVVSGYAAPEDVARSLEAGFAEHLTKPITVDQLTAAIRRLFDDSQPPRSVASQSQS